MQDPTIELHIRAAVRPGGETERLLADLVEYSWPGGTPDRSDPAKRGWLRHFQAIRPLGYAPSCTCHTGRCATCN